LFESGAFAMKLFRKKGAQKNFFHQSFPHNTKVFSSRRRREERKEKRDSLSLSL
jgi:hypothetical protein